MVDPELPTSAAAEDRPLLGWGQLLLPPFVTGASWVLSYWVLPFGCCMALLTLVFTLAWGWKVCDQIAEWRFTVAWEDSLKGERPRPDYFVDRLRGGLFGLEALAILLTPIWAAGVLTILERFGVRPP